MKRKTPLNTAHEHVALQLITADDACTILRISRPTVVRMMKTGELPSVIVGKKSRRIPLLAIRRMVDEAMNKA